MSDRKKENKMEDWVFIEQFDTANQLYRSLTTDLKGKLKSLPFAFLVISANTHLAHLQSRKGNHTTQTLQKSQILPTLDRYE